MVVVEPGDRGLSESQCIVQVRTAVNIKPRFTDARRKNHCEAVILVESQKKKSHHIASRSV